MQRQRQKTSNLLGITIASALLCCPAPLEAAETSQAEPPKPKSFLQGRIEQITTSNVLPEIILRKQSPKLDPRTSLKGAAGAGNLKGAADAGILNGGANSNGSGTTIGAGISAGSNNAELSSYPSYLVGRWGGNLKVVWSVVAKGIEDQLPQHRIGNIGSSVLHFAKVSPQQVKLMPSVVFFPIEDMPMDQTAMNTAKVETQSLEEYKSQILATHVLRGVPTIPLAKFDGEGVNGSKFISRVLHDTTKVLKPGTVEQDVVIGEWIDNDFYNYKEMVSRFIWYGPDKIYVQIMIANYGISRQAISKTLLEGWMGSNWQPTADVISQRLSTTWEDVERRHGIE